MYDHELKSLGLQITRCYSDNRKAKYKTHLALSSFGGKMRERFDGILDKQYTSWKGFQFFEEDFVAVAEKSKEWMTSPQDDEDIGAIRRATAEEEQDNQATTGDASEEGEIIYLSSESDNVLTHLKPNSTYIIGGLVDKNRHKGICHRRAVDRNIKTAKLPIKEYLEMRDRQVLVTNHVLEILLKWMEFGDWGKAFMEVMPKRKGGKLREDGTHDEDGEEDHEGNGEEQDQQGKVEVAKEAVMDADSTADAPETEVIEITKGLPTGETEAD
jgi:tRNA (guanine9-N1)-methyltransferase